jgi:tRNA threonylcarbamoyladenosine modification (KEOPS) complex  Pcc1 subunit
MSVERINVLVKIKFEDNEEAKIIHASIEPDNLSSPPMTIHSIYKTNKIIITIKNIEKIQTASATLHDLLSAGQVAENMIRMGNNH